MGLAEEDWHMPIESYQYFIILFRVNQVFTFYHNIGLSRIWATNYGIFDVRNGSVTCTELQKPTCHGEKWGCHGSGLQNMVFLK